MLSYPIEDEKISPRIENKFQIRLYGPFPLFPPGRSCSYCYQCIHWIRLSRVSRQRSRFTNLKCLPRSWLLALAEATRVEVPENNAASEIWRFSALNQRKWRTSFWNRADQLWFSLNQRKSTLFSADFLNSETNTFYSESALIFTHVHESIKVQ